MNILIDYFSYVIFPTIICTIIITVILIIIGNRKKGNRFYRREWKRERK